MTLFVTGLPSSKTQHVLSRTVRQKIRESTIRKGYTHDSSIQEVLYFYVHLRWTMDGPDSSYSSLDTHISSKVEREAKMDPPIQTEYLRSGGATILMVMD